MLQELTMTDNKIRQLLDEQGMTRYRLAKNTGLKNNTILSLTSPDQPIPDGTRLGTLRQIAQALGVTVADLLDE